MNLTSAHNLDKYLRRRWSYLICSFNVYLKLIISYCSSIELDCSAVFMENCWRARSTFHPILTWVRWWVKSVTFNVAISGICKSKFIKNKLSKRWTNIISFDNLGDFSLSYRFVRRNFSSTFYINWNINSCYTSISFDFYLPCYSYRFLFTCIYNLNWFTCIRIRSYWASCLNYACLTRC